MPGREPSDNLEGIDGCEVVLVIPGRCPVVGGMAVMDPGFMVGMLLTDWQSRMTNPGLSSIVFLVECKTASSDSERGNTLLSDVLLVRVG
jgi:hypothetical protein